MNDAMRWHDSAKRKVAILSKRLGDVYDPKPDAQGINLLHLAFKDLGFANVATGDFDAAKSAFCDSIRTSINLYRLIRTGDENAQPYESTGNFSVLLMAHAVNDSPLTTEFNSLFSASAVDSSKDPPDSNYIASLLVTVTNNVELPSNLNIDESTLDIDMQFNGYADCLNAIILRDVDRFQISLSNAVSNWQNFTRKHLEGHPQSICFMDGAALAKLAANQFGQPQSVDSKCVPDGIMAW